MVKFARTSQLDVKVVFSCRSLQKNGDQNRREWSTIKLRFVRLSHEMKMPHIFINFPNEGIRAALRARYSLETIKYFPIFSLLSPSTPFRQ